MLKKKQISESLILGIVLALSGGFMDAYSYVCRGEVFANAQTGNILLFAVNLSKGNFGEIAHYAVPMLAFAVGIVLADILQYHFKMSDHIHWRQLSVAVEAVILFAVAFFPQSRNLIANSLTSFACGIQVESFRKIEGYGMATTMCIGNLRTATTNLCDYFYSHDKKNICVSLLFYLIIAVFALGAVIGNICVKLMAEKAIIVSSFLLLTAFLLMFIKEEKQKSEKQN